MSPVAVSAREMGRSSIQGQGAGGGGDDSISQIDQVLSTTSDLHHAHA